MTPPSSAELTALRVKVQSSLPRPEVATDAISVPPAMAEPPAEPEPPAKPPLDLGDLTTAPTLHSYAEAASQGAEHLIELAQTLEEKSEFPRALLAWERVLDLAQPDENQAATAVAAIKRLRPVLPVWNTDATESLTIVVHAGTGKSLAKSLAPVLEEVAIELEAASAGTLKVKTMVTSGKSGALAKRPAPVAMWLAGPDKKKSSATEVLSFTASSSELLRPEVLKTVFTLVRGYIGRQTAYTPPAALGEDEDPADALTFRITRLCWREFGTAMNLPQVKPE